MNWRTCKRMNKEEYKEEYECEKHMPSAQSKEEADLSRQQMDFWKELREEWECTI